MKKRLLAMILALCLVIGLLPMTALAATEVVFEFGANGDAAHKDGNDISTGKTYESSGYSLTLENASKVYDTAYDQQGNSCLKLGTSKVVGSFTFTVPAEVNEVVIAAAMYKANATKLAINGTEHSLTKSSNNGEYDEIVVDTSSNKTVSVATVSGTLRAMINSITYVISEGGNVCEHPADKCTTETTDPTCTETGLTVVTCECGYVVSSTVLDATGHNYVDGVCSCGAEEPVATNDGVLILTVDTMGIASNTYYTGSVVVEGVNLSLQQIGNYGSGIQMRDKDGNTSILYNVDALGGAITKIELTFNTGKSTYDNNNAVIFSFGDAADNLTYETTLSTVAGTKTYTITPDAASYTFFKMEHDLGYTFYWDSIVIYYESDVPACDHEDTVKTETEVPATCTEDGKFTVTCECGVVTYTEIWPATGHTYVNGTCACGAIEPPTSVDPVVGTAYKFGMIQENKNDGLIYYLAGGMDGFYMATTTDVTAALDVYLEETTGGYYMYTVIDGTKTYINMVVSGTHVNGAYEATASTVYTYDAEAQTVIAVVNDTDYWFGTRNDKTYTTVGPCAVSYAGFYCKFYGEAAAPSVPGESAENPMTPEWTWNDAYTEATATVTIPANTTYYFSDNRVSNSFVLTANGEVVADIVYGSMMTRLPTTWTITNSTGAAVEYTLKLSVPVGTESNPAVAVLGNNNADVEEGTWGYYFNYTADFNGELKVEVSGEDNWTFTVNNLTTNKYNDIRWSDDDPVVNPDTIVVRKGDEVQIIVNGYDPANPQETPAANLNVKLTAVELKEIPLMRMALENSLAVQFAVPQAWTSDWTGYYAVVSHRLPDYSVEKTTIPASEWEEAGSTYWAVIYNNFAAKQMTDKLSVVIYNAQGEAITVPYESTVAQYAKRAFDSAKNDAARAMYVEMLYYGAAAQVRFEYNQDWELATDIIPTWDETDPMTIVANARQDVELTGTGAADAKVNHKGTRLQLEERIDLQMGFGVKFADVARVEVKCNGKNIEVTACPHPENSSMTAVYVDTLNLSECIHDVEIKLYNAAGEVIGSVTDSVRRWATRTVSAGTAAEAELALAQEIVNFSASVDNYMNPK